jgi:hypothetical protein
MTTRGSFTQETGKTVQIPGTTSHLGLEADFSFAQIFYDDSQNDRAERAYIFNTQGYRIRDQAIFVIEADGTRHVDNLQIVPLDEDFDFVGGWTSNLINGYLQARIDPWSISIPVNIVYAGNSAPVINYTQQQWELDRAYLTAFYSPISGPVEAFFDPLIQNLFDAGVTRFVDPQGRAIVYGTDGNDQFTAGFQLFQNAPLLALFAENGVVMLGHDGNDLLTGGVTNDDLRGGLGNDVIIGAGGNDVLVGDDGEDILIGIDPAASLATGEADIMLGGAGCIGQRPLQTIFPGSPQTA